MPAGGVQRSGVGPRGQHGGRVLVVVEILGRVELVQGGHGAGGEPPPALLRVHLHLVDVARRGRHVRELLRRHRVEVVAAAAEVGRRRREGWPGGAETVAEAAAGEGADVVQAQTGRRDKVGGGGQGGRGTEREHLID